LSKKEVELSNIISTCKIC